MELINRQAVLDGIDKYIEKAQSTGTKDDFISFAELGVKALPSAFEGMTNGEVLKSIFPSAELLLGNSDYLPNVFSVKEEWWDSPYQKGGEC